MQCKETVSVRSFYAALLLTLEYVELNINLDKGSAIISKTLQLIPSSPIFLWMSSLLYWRKARVNKLKLL